MATGKAEPLALRIRLRRLLREAAKFGTVGAFGFLVNVLVFNLAGQAAGLGPLQSGVLATSAAIATNYLGNRYWTYRHADKGRRRREAGLFLLFSGAGMLLENGVLAISHYGLGLTSPLADNIAKNVVGLGIGSLFRFWSYRTWVFHGVRSRHAVPPHRQRSAARSGAPAVSGSAASDRAA
ncbi:GtrA family protein [Streptomyces sp. YIM 98790]|uniref:GtrA family protein n=1 Tax=Streptomyces sp. YIM 98790 TaxID=2689077 RepID=UPI0014078880|nr:GtrA family protein [Streptomyces sp. YIM 98790]